jgi:formylglycine-generating enzyme required for sulfatase activity/lysophospholipase L1-like esterase
MKLMQKPAPIECLLYLALIGAPLAVPGFINPADASTAHGNADDHWIGTWATAPQPAMRDRVQSFQNQTLRLIVHSSTGGKKVRIRISNTFGNQPLLIGKAHIARRTAGADIDPTTDRTVMFQGRPSIQVPARSMVVSDPVNLDIPPLSDLAISLYLPQPTQVTTLHILALQTNYVSPENGDSTVAVRFTAAKTISSWPFLTGVDVTASSRGESIVAFGSSTTDGDGSTKDTNHRWPDLLAERLQNAGYTETGVLNEGIIGNRLLSDSQSPRQAGGPPPLAAVFEELGPALGPAGLARFEGDVLAQPGVKFVILALGVNDILFPGSFIPSSESITSQQLISGNRQLIAKAHKRGLRVIGTTIPPFEHAIFKDPFYDHFFSPEKDKTRQELNDWIRHSGEFDGVADLDAAVRDPEHPPQLLPAYDSGDHLHVNNAGNVAQADAISLSLFSHARAAQKNARRSHWVVPVDVPQAPTAGTIRLNPSDELSYVWIPAGTFTMGCSADDNECFDDEKPARQVAISKGFWISQTLVTQKAYKRVTGSAPSHFKGEQLPVEMVSWNDAQDYCRRLGMRLPTEVEWEYAARAGSTAARYGDLDAVAWYTGTSGPQPVDGTALYQSDPKNYEDNLIANGNQPHAVKVKQANSWQLYDTLGNVWEWTSDWFDKSYYPRSEERDPKGPVSGTLRTLRGGAWDDNARNIRVSNRYSLAPDSRKFYAGFRCVSN